MKILTHNFRWKIFSLVIAVFLWLYINNEVETIKRSHQPILLEGWELREGIWPR